MDLLLFQSIVERLPNETLSKLSSTVNITTSFNTSTARVIKSNIVDDHDMLSDCEVRDSKDLYDISNNKFSFVGNRNQSTLIQVKTSQSEGKKSHIFD